MCKIIVARSWPFVIGGYIEISGTMALPFLWGFLGKENSQLDESDSKTL
jgi:hypothetical protein